MASQTMPNVFLDDKAAASGSVYLPVRANLKLAYLFSLLVALIMGGVSLAGIIYQDRVYSTEEFLQTFLPIDLVNLCIGLPVLLCSMWLARRGRLIGLLFWPGALFYVTYSYLIPVFAMPPGWIFLLHLTLVMLSLYTLIGLLASIDGEMVRRQLSGKLPDKVTGGILAGFGLSFFLLAAGVMVETIRNQTPLPITEFALQKADFLVTPAWLIGGLLLWRQRAFGYVVGTGLLFQSNMLMISLLVVIILKPILTTDPFVVSDFVWILVFSLISFIPLARFIRGVLSAQRSRG